MAKKKTTEETETVEYTEMEQNTDMIDTPSTTNGAALQFEDLGDDEITVIPTRSRGPRLAFENQVEALVNAYNNGQVFKKGVPLTDKKEQYRYKNWVKELNKTETLRISGLIVRTELVEKDGRLYLRFYVDQLGTGE